MIEITPEIIGPGIEEEYADILERLDVIDKALKDHEPSNDTPEGRMLALSRWLRQEIAAERLPIPLDKRWWGTMAYMLVDGVLSHYGIEGAMGNLTNIFDGFGMVKKRHYPVVAAMIDDFLALVAEKVRNYSDLERKILAESREIRDRLLAGELDLPLDKKEFPGWAREYATENFILVQEVSRAAGGLSWIMFSGVRPQVCRKGPLKPRNPGLRAERGTR